MRRFTKCPHLVQVQEDMNQKNSEYRHFLCWLQRVWPVWVNGWVFIYELCGCGFESHCSHLKFRFRTCFEQGVPWHSGNYRVWIHFETRTWHDKNTQSDFLCCLYFDQYSLSQSTELTNPKLGLRISNKCSKKARKNSRSNIRIELKWQKKIQDIEMEHDLSFSKYLFW